MPRFPVLTPDGTPVDAPPVSAYETWLSLGNTGTEQDFLDSLIGADGADGQDGADGLGTITTVNGDSGPAVVLDAADVGAETPAGAQSKANAAAAAAQAAAIVAAEAAAAAAEAAAEATAAAALLAHANDTTGIHGISDTSALETTSGATSKANAAQAAAEATAAAAAVIHAADTTAVHGIANTAVLETTTGSQAKVDAAIAALIGGASGAFDTLLEIQNAMGSNATLAADLTNLIATKVARSLYNAHTVLAATTDDTPAPITIGEQTVLGRITGGNIAALTPSQMRTMLALVIGTDVQAFSNELAVIANLSSLANDDILQRKAGAWTHRTIAQLKTDLAYVKGDIGLGNVDNTSDANKPVSTAQQTAIDAKVADAINDGTTTVAPSQNAVFDALALKIPTSYLDLSTDLDGLSASDTKIASQAAVFAYIASVREWEPYLGTMPTVTAGGVAIDTETKSYELFFAGADLTSRVGQKLWATQGTEKAGFVTKAVLSGSDTTLTVYGGSDYAFVASSTTAITACRFSSDRHPRGFEWTKGKWRQTYFASAVPYLAGTATADVWYGGSELSTNGPGPSLIVPIGVWTAEYSVGLDAERVASSNTIFLECCLSNDLTTPPDSYAEMTYDFYLSVSGSPTARHVNRIRSIPKEIRQTAKATWYTMIRCRSICTNLGFNSYSHIEAVCAYL